MIKIGIVGVGGMGTVHHSNYQHLDGCRVTAVVGTSEQDRAKANSWQVPLYATIEEMLAAHPDLDVVDVCTPTFLHKQHALVALRAGKNTIVEKPAALHVADAREMFDAAREQGVHLYVAQVLQFTKEVEVLRDLVRSGEYGRPLDAYFERLSASPSWAQGGWLFQKEKSGLAPFDLHIHDLDVIVSLFGEPESFTYTSCRGQGRDYAEQYRFLYEFKGLHVGAEVGWLNADIPFTARWRVYFENAMVVNDGECVTAYSSGQPPRVFDTTEQLKIPTGINLAPTGIFHTELGHFLDCIREGKPSPRVPERQVLAVLALLEKISAGA